MRLAHHAHLAYCTNVHTGKDWTQTFQSLQTDVLAVRQNVCPSKPYAIGLRLSAAAAQDLAEPATLAQFQRWLEKNACYVFTINGFPYGDFHGQRVKEQVYRPDWTSPERLAYTKLLFDLLVQLLPPGVSGSVSTLPGSFKRFITQHTQYDAIYQNLHQLYQHIEKLSEKTGHDLHLGLEPEPLGLFENTPETLAFFENLLRRRSDPASILQRIGLNYDTCHFALQYENASQALSQLANAQIRISKIHLSSALKITDFSQNTLDQLQTYDEPTYLHQVLAASPTPNPSLSPSPSLHPSTPPLHPSPFTLHSSYEDLPAALAARKSKEDTAEEWRIHFHIPLHSQPAAPLQSTADHLLDTLDHLAANPTLCQHLEMETYTWAVLPKNLHTPNVVDQITAEYQWLLPQLKTRNLLQQS